LQTFDEIHRWLLLASRGLVENQILSPADVERRATWLAQDINSIRFEGFQILGLREFECWVDGHLLTFPLVEYAFGEKRNNIDNAEPRMCRSDFTKIRCMEGTSLNRGDLSYFSRVCEIGRRMIPSLWLSSDTLRMDLRTRGKHLSTLNEVWWLSLWPTLDSAAVTHEVQINPNSSSTVDWVFPLRRPGPIKAADPLVHLEVKQLLSTFATQVHGDAEPIRSLFRGIEDKFHPSKDGEINVVAATVMCEIDDCVDSVVCSRLKADDLIDAVCVWSPVAKGRSFLTRFNPRLDVVDPFKRSVVENSMVKPKPEDAQVCWLQHPDLALTERIFGKLPD
jgi:hypothetical protein